MVTITVKVGSRFQKAVPPHKIYRVVATIKRDGQPPHAQLAAQVDPSQVITVAVSALGDSHFWKPVE